MFGFLRSSTDTEFKARIPERDAHTDRTAIKLVADALDQVLGQAESERAGLKARMDDVTARAAVVGGNDSDEFLTRPKDRSDMLRSSDADIKRGHERLRTVEQNIAHFLFLKTVLQSRFPDTKI